MKETTQKSDIIFELLVESMLAEILFIFSSY